MATANLTISVDEGTKKEFDNFCENVGLSATSAVNMFIRTVVRTRALPFIITDNTVAEQENKIAMTRMKDAILSMREQSASNGNAEMTMDEINAEIAKYRQEKRATNA